MTAGDSKRGEGERGNSGFDRHWQLQPVWGAARCGPFAVLDDACSIPVRAAAAWFGRPSNLLNDYNILD
jgi:hypothetical protein